MDADRFDALTRTLSAAGSRRRALASGLAGLLGTLVIGRAEAKKKKPCPPCKKRKKGKCKKKRPNGTTCPGGACQDGACVATATSPPAPRCIGNCAGKVCGDDGCGGLCGFACTNGETCQNGACVCVSENTCNGVCCSNADDICTESPRVCCRPEKRCHKSCCARNESCEDGANGPTCEPMVIEP
jgi:hypothetical protein